jgi:hypothetical protein
MGKWGNLMFGEALVYAYEKTGDEAFKTSYEKLLKWAMCAYCSAVELHLLRQRGIYCHIPPTASSFSSLR